MEVVVLLGEVSDERFVGGFASEVALGSKLRKVASTAVRPAISGITNIGRPSFHVTCHVSSGITPTDRSTSVLLVEVTQTR